MLTTFMNWLFIESIFGIGIIAFIVYFSVKTLKKKFSKLPDPEIPAFLAFLIALIILPSLERFQFENETLSSIAGKEWIKVIDKAYYGAITEPLTWFNAPLGFLHFAMPNNLITGGFTEVILKYDEEPEIRMVDADCQEKTILFSEPDAKGTYRYTTNNGNTMTKKEYEIFCQYDWSKEKKAVSEYILNN